MLRHRTKDMADLDFLVRERRSQQGVKDPDHEEMRIGEAKNPSDLGEMEDSEMVENRGEENGDDSGVVRERKSGEEEEEVENSANPRGLVLRDRETPPDDDCCPICFGGFNIPCKTNCGHWFCASCILMFWSYSNALNRCKCPICARLINKLTPEASLSLQREEEVVEALKKVRRYNRLFVGGALGLIMKVLQLPLFFRRFFGGLMDPTRFRLNYYLARLIACVLTVIYEICGFDFIPAGILGVRRVFEYSAIALVLVLFLVGICHRRLRRRRARLLAAPQPVHA